MDRLMRALVSTLSKPQQVQRVCLHHSIHFLPFAIAFSSNSLAFSSFHGHHNHPPNFHSPDEDSPSRRRSRIVHPSKKQKRIFTPEQPAPPFSISSPLTKIVMTTGTLPQMPGTPSASATKKKSLFSLFSKKKSNPTTPTTNDQQKTPSNKSSPVATSSPASASASANKSKGKTPLSNNPSSPPSASRPNTNINDIPLGIFPDNVSLNETEIEPPEMVDYISDTSKLVSYLHILAKAKEESTALATSPSQPPSPTASTASPSTQPIAPLPVPSPPSALTPAQLEWTEEMDKNPLEKDHLHKILTEVINEFIRHPSKNNETVREIVLLGPVLDKDQYRTLLNRFLKGFKKDTMLNVESLRGLTQLIQDAKKGYLRRDDLTLILRVIRTTEEKHKMDENLYYLTVTCSKILNAMVDEKVVDGVEVEGLDRVNEHDPILELLSNLRSKEDPFLKFQALYAYQALQWVPNDETSFQCGLRRFAGVVGGIVKLSAVVQLDFQGFMGGLKDIQKEVADIYGFVSSGWEDAKALFDDGKGLLSLGVKQAWPWYVALRGAERLVAKGRLAEFNELVSKAPCRGDPLFLWGIAQLLGDIAIDSAWRKDTRMQALKFLGELYTSMAPLETHRSVQSWILTILTTISSLTASYPSFSSSSGNEQQDDTEIKKLANDLAQDLKADGNTPLLFQYPLRSHLPLPKASILLKEVNSVPDLELVLDRLRRLRLREYELPTDYIEPISKHSLKLSDDKDSPVPLRERVQDFLESKAVVMLIHGEEGSGKSAFGLALENELWSDYKAGDAVPLFIDLTAIETLGDKLIAQHLEGLDGVSFSECHLTELRRSKRPMILICDRYEKCKTWCNLYSENKMSEEIKIIVACHTEYLIKTYRAYFEPRSKDIYNKKKSKGVYEEAVIVPVKREQVEE